VSVTGSRGYDIVLTANQTVTSTDFGNFFGGTGGTIGGQKFKDLTGNGVKDAGDPPLAGVQIHLFDKATSGATVHQDTLTGVTGNYSFTVPAGEYILCEQSGPPNQTYPAADASGGLCATHVGIAGSRGYDITVANGVVSTGNNFGNLAAAPPPPPGPPATPIPTLDDFALLGLVALLGASGAFALPRRKLRHRSGERDAYT
jgi:hypothetical protein